jgi:hypothetical protein
MTKPKNQREYRKEKEDQRRIDEATQGGKIGHVVLGGGKPANTVKEVFRPSSDVPLQLPFDEVTPLAANPDATYGGQIGKPVANKGPVDEIAKHYGLPQPTDEEQDGNED